MRGRKRGMIDNMIKEKETVASNRKAKYGTGNKEKKMRGKKEKSTIREERNGEKEEGPTI